MLVFYGEKVFRKHKGYYGAPEECPVCHGVYSPAIVKSRTWYHIYWIPVIPKKLKYYRMCPVCGNAYELSAGAGKALMIDENTSQDLRIYALRKKTLKTLEKNKRYELWFIDNIAKRSFCVHHGLTKKDIRSIEKNRGLKSIAIIDSE